MYWSDLGNPNQNSILNTFQFAAKFHELLVGASLSAILVHRIRYDLNNSRGVPLGFLTSGYQVSSLGYLVSREFWGAVTTPSRRKSNSWLPLSVLVTIVFGLYSVVGPSSAIAMLPKLDWWPVKDPFSGTSASTFIHLDYDKIWPTHITSELLQQPENEGDCFDAGSDGAVMNQFCPSAGYDYISTWISGFQNQNYAPNFTVSADGGVYRYLSTANTNRTIGWSVSSTVSQRLVRAMGALYQYTNTFDLRLPMIGRPMLTPSLANGKIMKKPLVQAQCRLAAGNDSSSLYFPHDLLVTSPPDLHGDEIWKIPKSINTSALPNTIVRFNWVDMKDFTSKPSLGGVCFLL